GRFWVTGAVTVPGIRIVQNTAPKRLRNGRGGQVHRDDTGGMSFTGDPASLRSAPPGGPLHGRERKQRGPPLVVSQCTVGDSAASTTCQGSATCCTCLRRCARIPCACVPV